MKGYWIARVNVSDPERYKDYLAAAAEPFADYGAKFLVRGGQFEGVEGEARGRNIVIEFADYNSALACYRSEAYQKAAKIRQEAAEADIIVIEGYDG